MTTKIYLDFAKETTPLVIFAKQYDSDRSLTIIPLENGAPFTDEQLTSAELCIEKPDGSYVTATASVPSGREDELTVSIPAEALSVAGIAKAEIKMSSSSLELSSQLFYINIRESARGLAR